MRALLTLEWRQRLEEFRAQVWKRFSARNSCCSLERHRDATRCKYTTAGFSVYALQRGGIWFLVQSAPDFPIRRKPPFPTLSHNLALQGSPWGSKQKCLPPHSPLPPERPVNLEGELCFPMCCLCTLGHMAVGAAASMLGGACADSQLVHKKSQLNIVHSHMPTT